VVLGHTKCGAVKAACDHVDMGYVTSLIRKIEPAVVAEKSVTENRTSQNEDYVEKVAAINVRKTVQSVMESSPILRDMINAGTCGLIGAKHDITSGQVSFYEDTMLGFFKNTPDISAGSGNTMQLRSKL
jgi:carbonic anhydrase